MHAPASETVICRSVRCLGALLPTLRQPMTPPPREIRALQSPGVVRVYQAFSHEIVDAALRSGKLVEPFKRGRMTWIKPSFLWMMYRSSWAQAKDQERILGVDLRIDGLVWAIENACLSTYRPEVHGTPERWRALIKTCPVRVQWDPERSLRLGELEWRAIQIGLSRHAVDLYIDQWTVALHDVTPLVRQIRSALDVGDETLARSLLPNETPVSLTPPTGAQIRLSSATPAL